jgi:hypothetical protein
MKTYEFTVTVQVSVAAPSESDAMDMVKDTFGEGEVCGLDVKDFEVEIIDES